MACDRYVCRQLKPRALHCNIWSPSLVIENQSWKMTIARNCTWCNVYPIIAHFFGRGGTDRWWFPMQIYHQSDLVSLWQDQVLWVFSLVFTFPARCFADVSHAYWCHAELDNLDKTGAVKQVDGTILVTASFWPLCWCSAVTSSIKSRRGSWPRKFFYSMGLMKE